LSISASDWRTKGRRGPPRRLFGPGSPLAERATKAAQKAATDWLAGEVGKGGEGRCRHDVERGRATGPDLDLARRLVDEHAEAVDCGGTSGPSLGDQWGPG